MRELKHALAAEFDNKRVIESQYEELLKVVQVKDDEIARLLSDLNDFQSSLCDQPVRGSKPECIRVEELEGVIISKDAEIELLRSESKILQQKILEFESKVLEHQAPVDLNELKTAKAQVQK